MDSPPPSQSILETLRTVEFRLGLKGYNVDEVDEYLEKAAVEAEAIHEQFRQLHERLRQATDRIAQLEGERREAAAGQPAGVEAAAAEDALQRTLVLAQKFVDQTKRESEAEAAELIAKAEEQARATLSTAEEQARQVASEADRRLRDEVTRLEGMRGQLASDVENMARHLETERTRLRASLGELLKWVEENIQPASSLMALRSRGEEKAEEGSHAQPRSAAPPPPQEQRPQGQPAPAEERPQGERDAQPGSAVRAAGGTPAERS